MTGAPRTKILCVDDEPNVLEGLALHLGRPYELSTAGDGAAGLRLMESAGPFAVVISDMRMPVMDGATFLRKACELAPDTTRLLLTGHADLTAAIAAVNDGHIFRFLTKPCPPDQLLAACGAAVRQHELVSAERVLLDQTLHGSIKALMDVLALTHPAAFGRSLRIRGHVTELAAAIGLKDRWQVVLAAMVSQLGCISLTDEVAEKLYYGRPLGPEEQAAVARVPEVTRQILASIPRLEGVLAILERMHGPLVAARAEAADPIVLGARLLRLVSDYEALEVAGMEPAAAIETLRGRGGYDPATLDAFQGLHHETVVEEVREIPLAAVLEGMVFAQDVLLSNGVLLVARGFEVTAGFVARARNYPRGTVQEPVRVITSKSKPLARAA
jgi:response regulator RpfG family c-di-GMP phosphodiesterase